jgi:hypothetical protein
MTSRSKLIVTALVLLFVATGFFREFVFLNWNEQMRVSYYHSPESYVSPSMQWLGSFSYGTLYWLKWPLTLFFSVLFAAYSLVIVHVLFRDKKYNRIVLWAYASVFATSLLFFAGGWAFGVREFTYDIARFLAGIIETPAMLIILVASFLLHRRM